MDSHTLLKEMERIQADFTPSDDLEALIRALMDIRSSFTHTSGITTIDPDYQQASSIYRRLCSYLEFEDYFSLRL